jgi:Na+-translocating ferredoxin:NAD+ oxidoreductase RnfC subunit
MVSDIIEAVERAGVVGAGGAGFPTHVKLQAGVRVVIANGSECEPLLCCDKHLMCNNPQVIIQGLSLAMQATGADQGIIAVKAKQADVIQALSRHLPVGGHIRIHQLQDYYPIGDEQLLVYEVTGKLVPPGGLPLKVGVLVCNVATLHNIAQAQQGVPVTHRYVSIAGEVPSPKTLCVPIGTSLRDLIELAGGSLISDPALIVGGPMMGSLVDDMSLPVTKTTGGVLVLKPDHSLVLKRRFWAKNSQRQAASLCYQCGSCTQLCPRNLLGHDISPQQSMLKSGYIPLHIKLSDPFASLCSECGLCAAYACRMGLSPLEMHRQQKANSGAKTSPAISASPHLSGYARYVPTPRLILRLGLRAYNIPIPFDPQTCLPNQVCLPLKQHIGVPAVPVVNIGEHVRAGQLVAEPPAGSLGAKLHTPIDGEVFKTTPCLLIRC